MNENLITPIAKTAELKRSVFNMPKSRLERTYDPDGLEIAIQFNGEPTEGTYEFLKDFSEFRLEQIKKAKKVSNVP